MITVKDWLESQKEQAYIDYEIRPSLVEVLDGIEETIQCEISTCKRAIEKGKPNDYDFFLECAEEFPYYRTYEILRRAYGDTYIHRSPSYEEEVTFYIDKYYDSVGSDVIKELIKTFGSNFSIGKDKFSRLTISLKK